MRHLVYILLLVLSIGAVLWVIDRCCYPVYERWRLKRNKTLIGHVDFPLTELLKENDYVGIDGRVYRFSHIADMDEPLDVLRPPSNDNKTIGGELAFEKPNGLGYFYYLPGALEKCDFIYGKYGTKWAATKELADSAKQRVDNYYT